jgi:hypothetical protein
MITIEEAKKLKEGDTILYVGDGCKFVQLVKNVSCPVLITNISNEPNSDGLYDNCSNFGLSFLTLPTKKKTYRPFTYEECCVHLGKRIEENSHKCTLMLTLISHDSASANGYPFDALADNWHFLDTGLPVGMEVEE